MNENMNEIETAVPKPPSHITGHKRVLLMEDD